MKTLKLLAVALAASSGLAFSQTTIVQTLNFSGVPDLNQALQFNKYAGNVADITNIDVSYSLSIKDGLFIIDNDANTPAVVTVNFGAALSATSTDVNLLNASFQPIIFGVNARNNASFSLAANVGDGPSDFDPTGPDGAKLLGQTVTSTGSDNVNSAFYYQFAGGGTYTIHAIATQVSSLSFNSGIETATNPVDVTGFVTITYTVPEPSSTALLGLGVFGLVFRRRRG